MANIFPPTPIVNADRELQVRVPFAQWEYVEVTFSPTANADTTIKHTLRGPKPELIDWEVVRAELTTAPGTVPIVYRDGSSNRRPWDAGYIVLRCNVASFKCTLRLSTRFNEVS
jgi:hypothetical protein